jgi:hypothetical protein
LLQHNTFLNLKKKKKKKKIKKKKNLSFSFVFLLGIGRTVAVEIIYASQNILKSPTWIGFTSQRRPKPISVTQISLISFFSPKNPNRLNPLSQSFVKHFSVTGDILQIKIYMYVQVTVTLLTPFHWIFFTFCLVAGKVEEIERKFNNVFKS